jgi:hypothetical protein
MSEPVLRLITRGKEIRYPVLGEARDTLGIREVALRPTHEDFEVRIGTIVTFEVVEIRRETVERKPE